MFRRKPLIHLLVSLVLVLNGIGATVASVRMEASPADGATHAALAEVTQVDSNAVAMEPGCPGHKADAATPDEPSSDCCATDACNCGCVHHFPVVLTAVLLVMPTIAPASPQWKQLASSPSPSLVHPTRPPII